MVAFIGSRCIAIGFDAHPIAPLLMQSMHWFRRQMHFRGTHGYFHILHQRDPWPIRPVIFHCQEARQLPRLLDREGYGIPHWHWALPRINKEPRVFDLEEPALCCSWNGKV